MNNKLPISCFIIAKNEADRIAQTIESVEGLVDEIIVIDSGSTDGTQDLVKELGCKLYYNKWHGFGPQKRFGEDKARNKWLLNLDADEYLSNELKAEIRDLFSKKLKSNFPRISIIRIDEVVESGEAKIKQNKSQVSPLPINIQPANKQD